MLYDKDIREPLFDFLEGMYGKIRILEEKQMGKSRADIVMVLPDLVAGIEIKSDADTYVRLKRQVKDYDQFYDRNYVAAGSSHALHIEEHVPEWWGIITVEQVDGQADFYLLREARPNPEVNLRKKLSILWRPELAHIQELNDMPKYKEKSKQFVIDKIAEKIPGDILSKQISDTLFERDYNEIEHVIQEFKRTGPLAPGNGAPGVPEKAGVHDTPAFFLIRIILVYITCSAFLFRLTIQIIQYLLGIGIRLCFFKHLLDDAILIYYIGASHHSHGNLAVKLFLLPHIVCLDGSKLRVGQKDEGKLMLGGEVGMGLHCPC